MKKISCFAVLCALGIMSSASYGASSLVSGGTSGAMVARAGSLRTNNVAVPAETKSASGSSETRAVSIGRIKTNISPVSSGVSGSGNTSTVNSDSLKKLADKLNVLEQDLMDLKNSFAAISAGSEAAMNFATEAKEVAGEAKDAAANATLTADAAEKQVTEAVLKQLDVAVKSANEARELAVAANDTVQQSVKDLNSTVKKVNDRADSIENKLEKEYAKIDEVKKGFEDNNVQNEQVRAELAKKFEENIKTISSELEVVKKDVISAGGANDETVQRIAKVEKNLGEISGVLGGDLNNANNGIAVNSQKIKEMNDQLAELRQTVKDNQEEIGNGITGINNRIIDINGKINVLPTVDDLNKQRGDLIAFTQQEVFSGTKDAKEYADAKAKDAEDNATSKAREFTAGLESAAEELRGKYKLVTDNMTATLRTVDDKLADSKLDMENNLNARILQQTEGKFVTTEALEDATAAWTANLNAKIQPITMNINTINNDIAAMPKLTATDVNSLIDSKTSGFVTTSNLADAVTNKVNSMNLVTTENFAQNLPEDLVTTGTFNQYLPSGLITESNLDAKINAVLSDQSSSSYNTVSNNFAKETPAP